MATQSSVLRKLKPFLSQHKAYIDGIQLYLDSGCKQWALCLTVKSDLMWQYLVEQTHELGLKTDIQYVGLLRIFIPLSRWTRESMQVLDGSIKSLNWAVETTEQEKREIAKELGLDEAALYGQLGGLL